jgi:hypothetical protein
VLGCPLRFDLDTHRVDACLLAKLVNAACTSEGIEHSALLAGLLEVFGDLIEDGIREGCRVFPFW